MGMLIKILGSAAGGGFPQWNCACNNCHRLREGSLQGKARTQAQLAWSVNGSEWALLNASPDLREQIEGTPELCPRHGRSSPICDVVLTGGEVDQALGLLLLREFHRFHVHATAAVRRILTEDNSLFGVLARFTDQVRWHDIPLSRTFLAGGARLEAFPIPDGGFPGFVSSRRTESLDRAEAVIGLLITPESGGATMAFLPGIGSVSDALMQRLEGCSVILFDGTFWTDDELKNIPGVNRTAREMGHLPLSGPGGSLERLAGLTRSRRIFIHINNTNPILDEASEAHGIVRRNGWEVAWDGMEIHL